MDDLPPLPGIPTGRYRHYKGGEYEVVGTVRHSETLEPLVLYRPLYSDSGMWVRPFGMFLERVEVDGQVQPRFAPVAAGAPAGEPDLAATVERMEARLSASQAVRTRELMRHYRLLSSRFEQDLGGSVRDVLLAKASALMLVQAAGQAGEEP